MIKVGTCGFKFDDWRGVVYPEELKDSEELTYYNRVLGFDLVEIDVSYYTLLSPRVAQAWLRKTDPEFLFAVKCHREMTLNEQRGVDYRALDNADVFKKFNYTFEPMAAEGRLVAYLAQFGPMFRRGEAEKEYLLRFRERMAGHPLVVEFRHRSWLDEEHGDETFRFLREHGFAYAAVDEPRLRSLAPFVPAATADIAYVRLHGRSQQWFGAGSAQRYDYFYSDEELTTFLDPVKALGASTALTTVLFNNCHAGAAVKNAVRMKELLLAV